MAADIKAPSHNIDCGEV